MNEVNAKNYGAAGNGLADDTTAILAAGQAAASTGAVLYLPASTYRIGAGLQGGILTLLQDGLVLRGDGPGKTILRIADGLALTQDLYAVQLTGKGQHVEGLTIQGPSSVTLNGFNANGISLSTTSRNCVVSDVEIVGITGAKTAGAIGVDIYVPYDQPGRAGHMVDSVTVRDSVAATAFAVNALGCTLCGCRAINVGNNGHQHGYYVQSGLSLFDGCISENAGGYSFHQHTGGNGNVEMSGNRYVNCLSLNPGAYHFVCDTDVSNGQNPLLPKGCLDDRYTLFDSCIFRNTDGRWGHGYTTAPTTFADCAFEDVALNLGDGGRLTNSTLRRLLASDSLHLLDVGNGCLVSGNHLGNLTVQGIGLGDDVSFTDNVIEWVDNNAAIGLNPGNNNVLSGNHLSLQGSGAYSRIFGSLGTDCQIHHNQLAADGANAYHFALSNNQGPCNYHDNIHRGGAVARFDGFLPSLSFRDNQMMLSWLGYAAVSLPANCGRLLPVQCGTAILTTIGQPAKMANGKAVPLAVGDAYFAGVVINWVAGQPGTSTGTFLGGQPGGVCPVLIDGPWQVGNVAVVSPSDPMRLHDSGGSVAPASGSYGLLLDSGTAAGMANVLVLRTL